MISKGTNADGSLALYLAGNSLELVPQADYKRANYLIKTDENGKMLWGKIMEIGKTANSWQYWGYASSVVENPDGITALHAQQMNERDQRGTNLDENHSTSIIKINKFTGERISHLGLWHGDPL